MIRYCSKCKKGFDFTIKSMTDLDNLTCPECGSHIDKNSRTMPGEKREEDQAEVLIGGFFYFFYRFRYYFFAIFSAIGIIAYFVGMHKLMLAMTILCTISLFTKLTSGRANATISFGIIGIGIAFCYYYIDKSFDGICLGILFGFLIRFIIKDILYTLLFKFIRSSTR